MTSERWPRTFAWIEVDSRNGLLFIKQNRKLLPIREFLGGLTVVAAVCGTVYFLLLSRGAEPPIDLAYEAMALLLGLVAMVAIIAIFRAQWMAANPIVIDPVQQCVRRGQRILFSGPFVRTEVYQYVNIENGGVSVRLINSENRRFLLYQALGPFDAQEFAELIARNLNIPAR